MANWLREIMPKEAKFFPLFDRLVQSIEEGATELRAILADGGDAQASRDKLGHIVQDGNKVSREILSHLRASFVTPFDRAGIKEMTGALQAALDAMPGAARARRAPGLDRAPTDLAPFADMILECAQALRQGVPLLARVDRHADELRAMRDKISDVRATMAERRDEAMLRLVEQGEDKPVATLASITFLDRLATVVERLDDAADRIDDLVLDHV